MELFKSTRLIVFTFLLTFSCGTNGHTPARFSDAGSDNSVDSKVKVLKSIPDVFVIQDIPIYDPLSGFADVYKNECLERIYLRCPPYTEYWIAEAWIDVCDNYSIIDISNCKWQHDCNPLDPMIVENQPCQTEDGSPGIQNVYCDKGKVQLEECSPCTDEICDGIDNDCDGEIDEGDYTCETQCGIGPAYCVDGNLVCEADQPGEEICDYLDNDCDGEIDEGQRNVCNKCGPVPEEICNGIDDDCDDEIDEDLMKECATVCETGYEICMFGQWTMCTADQPWIEVCNGEDDDCNGLVDDGLDCECQQQDVGILIPCFESPLVCGQGYKTCECKTPECLEFIVTQCKAACTIFDLQPCDPEKGMIFPEICNNWDDNCNFLVDEDLYKSCYEGPASTLNVGECKEGILACTDGNWGGFVMNGSLEIFVEDYCDGQVLPKEEICNGKDDDCDGVIEEELTETDIVFIVDLSGSMQDEIDAVIDALTAFSLSYQDEPQINWGLIIGPYNEIGSGIYKEKLNLKTNLGPFSSFLSSVLSLDGMSLNGGYEPLYDAVYLSIDNICDSAVLEYQASDLAWKYTNISDPTISAFNIDWREDSSKVIVVFTDEPGQSFMTPPGESSIKGDAITQDIVVSAINGSDSLKVFVFSPTNSKNSSKDVYINGSWVTIPSGWEPLTLAGDAGQWYEIVSDSAQMFTNLMEVLEDTACGGL